MPLTKKQRLFCPSLDNPEKVMVFSHGGEPALLSAVQVNRRSILVYGSDERKKIAYPRRYVFRMDRNLFEGLLDAYSSGNDDRLNKLWGQAQSV